MPVDTVSEQSLAPTGDTSGANTGRRRARRTTGASGTTLQVPAAMESAMAMSQPGAPVQVHRSPLPLMESLENLTEDIADVPIGGHLPPIRLPPKPTRVVAPLPVAPPIGAAHAPPVFTNNEPPFFYVQKGRSFKKTKGWPAMIYPKRGTGIGSADGQNEQTAAEDQRQIENELLDVGLIVQRVQQTSGTFVCGFLAGLTSWYAICAQLLFSHLIPRLNDNYLKTEAFATFILFYQAMSMPIGCIFYLLLAFSLLTILDRYDVSFVTKKDVLLALRLQNGAIPLILLYLAALVVTLVCVQHDARMYLVTKNDMNPLPTTTTASATLPLDLFLARGGIRTGDPATRQQVTNAPQQLVFQRMIDPSTLILNNETSTKQVTKEAFFDINELDNSVTLWLRLNFARAACCTLAWLVMVIVTDQDRLAEYLRSMMNVSPNNNSSSPSNKPATLRQKAPPIETPASILATVPQTPTPINAALQPQPIQQVTLTDTKNNSVTNNSNPMLP